MSAGGSLVGRVLDDRYRVIAEIGRGGHGTVYRGVHLQLERPVAIKVIARPSSGVERRFRREAQAQARLRHPAVVKLLDFGHDQDGNPYMVQEYVDGRSLQARFKGGVPPLDETVTLIGDVLDALAEAHALGLVHRDVKPSNIMVTQGPRRIEARLLDFGVVKLLDPDAHTRLTRAGALVGTPGYMAPEQVSLLPVTPATDLYSVGVVLYQALAGRRPYGGTVKAVLRAQLHDDPPPLPAHVPPALAQVALTAMSREPSARHADADAMRAALLAAFELERGAPTRVTHSAPTRVSGALPRVERAPGPPTPTPQTGHPSAPSDPSRPLDPTRVTAHSPSPTAAPARAAPASRPRLTDPSSAPASAPSLTPHTGTLPPRRSGVAPVALLALLLALATAGVTVWLSAGETDGPVHRIRAGDRPAPPAQTTRSPAPRPTARAAPAATVLPPVAIGDPDAPALEFDPPDAAPADAASDVAARSRRRARRRPERRPPPAAKAPAPANADVPPPEPPEPSEPPDTGTPTAESDAEPPAEPRVAGVADVEARIDAAFDRCACDAALELVDALARLDSAAARLQRSRHRRRCRLALPGNCVTGGAP